MGAAQDNAGTALAPAVPKRSPLPDSDGIRDKRRAKLRTTLTGYAFLIPSAVGVLVFMLVPVIVILWLTVHQWDLLQAPNYVGPSQIGDVLTDRVFLNSVKVTITLVLLVVPIQIGLGLAFANLLTKKMPASKLFRTLIVIPWISSPLALGVVWSWIFAPTGGLLSAMAGRRLEILVSPDWALPTVAFVIIWNNVGYTSLFFIAGLLSIPEEILEAAKVDGASGMASFWRIKVPLLKPTFFFVSVTSVIAVFNIFDQVYALTGGGPAYRTDVLAYRIYDEAFNNWHLGKASVMAAAMMVILLLVTVAQNIYFRRTTTYEHV